MAFGDWWGRRSRKAKIWLIVGAAVLVLIVIGALSSPGEESDDATPGTTTVVVTEQATTTEDAEETTTWRVLARGLEKFAYPSIAHSSSKPATEAPRTSSSN